MAKYDAPPSEISKKSSFFYGYVIVGAAFLVLTALNAGIYSYGVFLKPMAEEFDWTRAMTSGPYSLAMFIMGIFFMVTGRINDRFGPRLVTSICGFIFGMAFILMSQIHSLWQLYVFYSVMVGLGMSGGMVPMMSTVARWFTRRRGLMTGIVLSGVGVGTMVSPPVASQLILSHGWRIADISIGIAFLVMLVAASQFLKRDPGKVGQLPYGERLQIAGKVAQGSPLSATTGFFLRDAMRTWQMWLLIAMYVLFGTSQMGIMIHIVPHATDAGISPIDAAKIMSVIGALSLTGRIALGGIADRIGAKRSLIIGLALMSAALLALQLAREMPVFYIFAVLFGFGYGGDVALISMIVAELFGMKAHGTVLGVVSFAYTIGCAIGPLLAGRIFDTTSSYLSAFWVFAGLCVAGLALTMLLKPTSNESPLQSVH